MKLINIFLFSFLMVTFTRCTEDIVLDLKTDDPQIWIDGEITNIQRVHRVHISKTTDYYGENPVQQVSGAKVEISDDTQSYSLTESPTDKGFYLTDATFKGEIGKTYELTVTIDNNGVTQIYTAKSTMQQPLQLISVTTNYHESYLQWDVNMSALDVSDVEDYQIFKVYRNDTLISDVYSKISTWNSSKYYSQTTIPELTVQAITDEDDGLKEGDKVTLQIDCCEKLWKDYVAGFITETSSRIPMFSGPPANPQGNINGAKGCFRAVSVVRGNCFCTGK